MSSLRSIPLAILGALLLAAGFLWLALDRKAPPRQPTSRAMVQPLEGRLDIRSLDDIRVGGSRVILCGVVNGRPAALGDILTDAARRHFQGQTVTCRPVGSGTPCDGRAASTFGGVMVAQCTTADGRDIAAELAAQQILCDLPAQSGGHYTACGR